MAWNKISTTPELLVYEDSYGNFFLKSVFTGRFLPKTYTVDYGRGGYGETVGLSLSLK